MGSLARFPYRLKVEPGETSKWEVPETGKALEPPNTKNLGFGHVYSPQFPPAKHPLAFLKHSSSSRTRFPPLSRELPAASVESPTMSKVPVIVSRADVERSQRSA